MLRKLIPWIVFAYGALLVLFGCLGYFRGGSMISLMIGGTSGLLVLLAAWAMLAQRATGARWALIFTSLLTALFIYRYTVTTKPVTGFLALLSCAVLLALLAHRRKA